MRHVFLYDGLRTPFGRYAGALAPVRPDDLLAGLIATLVKRSGFDAIQIEDVIAGCVIQAGEDSRNVARHAALLAGLPTSVAGITVNRLCGSGLSAVLDGCRTIAAEQGDVVIAGGVESMSRAPFVFSKGTSAFARDVAMCDTTLGASFPNPALRAGFGSDTMAQTADTVGRELGIGRDESDRFALASQQKFAAAELDGFFAEEIAPVSIVGKRDQVIRVGVDEHPRRHVTLDGLARLEALDRGGVVTAGNASGINDGASAVLLATRQAGEKAGRKPLCRIVTGAVGGVEPRLMGLGPVPATEKALRRAGLSLAEMDVIEINEAFATQVLGCMKQLRIEGDGRVNPNGGAIAIGHPLGASGGRLVLTAARQLAASGGRYALVTMCIGLGQGIAVILESVR